MSKQVGSSEFDLVALFDLSKRDILNSINCHAVGTIQKFDAAKQVAQVTLNYKRYYGDPPVVRDYPVLVDCPVVVMQGGQGALTFPIQPGDTCLVLFNDRDMDAWFASGQVVVPETPRTHSLSDAIALVGLRSLKQPIAGYETQKTSLRHGTTRLTLGDKVRLENSVTDLAAVIEGLIDTIKMLTTLGGPTNQAIDPASQAALEAYKTTVRGLLE